MDNKKEQTELKATNIISLFHPKKKNLFFFLGKKAGRHFGFLKKAGHHQKGAGRRALQKRPRQNTEFVDRFRQKKQVGKKWGTSDFSWGLVTFQGYSSPRPVENLA